MRTESDKTDFVRIRIKPYKKEVIFNMTLHVTRVISSQLMRFILRRYGQFILKQSKDLYKFCDLLWLITKPLIVLLIL